MTRRKKNRKKEKENTRKTTKKRTGYEEKEKDKDRKKKYIIHKKEKGGHTKREKNKQIKHMMKITPNHYIIMLQSKSQSEKQLHLPLNRDKRTFCSYISPTVYVTVN